MLPWLAPLLLAAQPPTFRSGVELIDVAVVVRDQNGCFVENLTAADFEVIEDGIPQAISAFDRVSIPLVRPRGRVPRTAARWRRTSPSVLMVTKGEPRPAHALETPPTAARTFVAGDRIVAAVEAYIPRSVSAPLAEGADVQTADGRVVLQRREPLTSRRTAETTFTIDTGTMAPGEYVLRVRLTDTRASSDTERRLPFRIIPNPSQ